MTAKDKQAIVQQMVNKDIFICVGYHRDRSNESYEYMQYHEETIYAVKHMEIDELIKKAWKLVRPKFTNITTLCLDIIGTEIWVDGLFPIVPENAFISKDNSYVMANGETYFIDRLYIKE